jgi:scyllo-inositol 2-dehydrogenase (NADP+)
MNSISTALLSFGMSGEVFHAPLLNTLPGFALTTVMQRHSNHAALHYPGVKVVRSIREILEDESIELVVVNTPNETHADFARQALQAGKHVVVEKPFTVSVQEADQLITLANQKQRVLTVFQNRRWDGDFLTVQKVVESNVLGKLAEVEVHYDRYRNYIESNTWKEETAPGTGILYNLGSHMLDQVLVLFGMPQQLDARIGIQRPNGKVDDYYDIRLQYKDLLVIVKSSYLVREPGPRYTLHGVNGSFVKHGIDPQEQALKEKKRPDMPGWGEEPAEWWGQLHTTLHGLDYYGKIRTLPGHYLAFYQNVYEAIREGKALVMKAEPAGRRSFYNTVTEDEGICV